MKDLGTRLITAVIGIIALLFVVITGGTSLAVGVLLLSLIGIWEFNNALNKMDINPLSIIGYIAAISIFIINISNIDTELYMMFVINLTVTSSLIYFLIGENITITDLATTLLGVLYIPFSLTHIFYLDGTDYIWLIFIVAFGSDTFAYFAGNFFGKHKLSPNISPNKTIEGSVGGVLGAALLAGLFGYFMEIGPIWKLVVLGVIGSIFSQIGDLIASKIKRTAGVKDYGFIFPGHGGVLDRFDSIILATPLIYYYIKIFLT